MAASLLTDKPTVDRDRNRDGVLHDNLTLNWAIDYVWDKFAGSLACNFVICLMAALAII